MGKTNYIVITNNPLVQKKLEESVSNIYKEMSYEETLKEVRDRIHKGHRLLSHPLSGSVKPGETPYKSVIITAGAGRLDSRSLEIIEAAIQTCRKFESKQERYRPEVYEDFQMIDWTLLESGLASADAW